MVQVISEFFCLLFLRRPSEGLIFYAYHLGRCFGWLMVMPSLFGVSDDSVKPEMKGVQVSFITGFNGRLAQAMVTIMRFKLVITEFTCWDGF